MKSFTDIEQSKRLAKILLLESADMGYIPSAEDDDGNTLYTADFKSEFIFDEDCIPCWSLAALLDVIPQVKLDSVKQYDKKCWRCCAYFASDWHNSDWCDNPVDACYELILKLHERKLLN